jgi:hypothetical protein
MEKRAHTLSYYSDEENYTQPNSHSFIVRMWVNDSTQGAEHPDWRGYVTHVPSGDRRYFKTLEELCIYIQNHFTSSASR